MAQRIGLDIRIDRRGVDLLAIAACGHPGRRRHLYRSGVLVHRTDFANPAVTIARALTDTFAGIRPVDVPGLILAELLGGMAAIAMFRWLVPDPIEASVGEPHAGRKRRLA
jgi:hypothetical protein